LIKRGELVVIPTDTIYGLAADATSDAAVERVFRAKRRAPDKPLLALVASLGMAESCAVFCSRARALADEFWPGPLTLVLPRTATSPLSPLVDRGAQGVSLRFPANAPACAVVAQAGCPVTAPSANRSGTPFPRTAPEALASLGHAVAMAIDAGPAQRPVESTVLALTDSTARVLRPGAIAADAIENVIGPVEHNDASSKCR
jgi:L-threonylcarbamoyladenylate synthase